MPAVPTQHCFPSASLPGHVAGRRLAGDSLVAGVKPTVRTSHLFGSVDQLVCLCQIPTNTPEMRLFTVITTLPYPLTPSFLSLWRTGNRSEKHQTV